MKPDFIGIGAVKSGSGWLYKNLDAQPKMWLPPVKELHYFDLHNRRFPKVIERLSNLNAAKSLINRLRKSAGKENEFERNWFWNFNFKVRDDHWYCSLFPNDSGLIKGEITPQYASVSSKAIQRAHSINPKMKVIYCLRDPTERTVSHLRMIMYKDKKAKISGVLSSEMLQKENDYVSNLKRWFQYFDRENILVLFYEELLLDPVEFLRKVSAFLDNNEELVAIEEKILSRPNSFEYAVDNSYKVEIAKRNRLLIASQHKYFNNRFTTQWLENNERLLS